MRELKIAEAFTFIRGFLWVWVKTAVLCTIAISVFFLVVFTIAAILKLLGPTVGPAVGAILLFSFILTLGYYIVEHDIW